MLSYSVLGVSVTVSCTLKYLSICKGTLHLLFVFTGDISSKSSLSYLNSLGVSWGCDICHFYILNKCNYSEIKCLMILSEMGQPLFLINPKCFKQTSALCLFFCLNTFHHENIRLLYWYDLKKKFWRFYLLISWTSSIFTFKAWVNC